MKNYLIYEKRMERLWTALNTAGVIIESEMDDCEINYDSPAKELEKWEQWYKALTKLGNLEEYIEKTLKS